MRRSVVQWSSETRREACYSWRLAKLPIPRKTSNLPLTRAGVSEPPMWPDTAWPPERLRLTFAGQTSSNYPRGPEGPCEDRLMEKKKNAAANCKRPVARTGIAVVQWHAKFVSNILEAGYETVTNACLPTGLSLVLPRGSICVRLKPRSLRCSGAFRHVMMIHAA